MKKIIGMLMATILCLNGLSVAPAFALENEVSNDVEQTSEVAPRAFLQKTETISSASNIKLTVAYTYNDGYDVISGIRSVKLAEAPSSIKNVTWTYQEVDGGSSYVFTITFQRNGKWDSETATLWA